MEILSIRNIFIGLFVALIVGFVYNYNSMSKEIGTLKTNNATLTNTVKELNKGTELKVKSDTITDKTAVDTIKLDKEITIAQEDVKNNAIKKIDVIKKKSITKAKLESTSTPEANAVNGAQIEKEINTVRIDALWEAYNIANNGIPSP